jgi:high frequency lysogenization protein
VNDSPLTEQVIALAALVQACYLVNQIAKKGSIPDQNFNPLLQSLFQFNPDKTLDIYGNLANLNLGLGVLSDLLDRRERIQHQETLRYTVSILHLETKTRSNQEMLAIIRSRLEHTAFAAEHFDDHYDSVCRGVSALYQDTLSRQRQRIHVSGSITQLQDSRIADRVRTLLLIAFRAAFLWRQLGGRRRHLLFRQSDYRKEVHRLEEQLKH